MILHITSRSEWQSAQARGEYRAASLETEGFMHASTRSQVLPVANTFYRGQNDLVLLVIDEQRVVAEVRWEAPAGPPPPGVPASDRFPHIYGPLNLEAVDRVLDLAADPDGSFPLPSLE
ncbi:MAG TPA: DUF952 domain-containing protein [Anaerolineales bacterium]